MNGKILCLILMCLFLHLRAETYSKSVPGLNGQIELCIPENFVAVSGELGIRDWVYLGPKDVVLNYLKDHSSLQTAIIRLRIDPKNTQTMLINSIFDDKFPDAIKIDQRGRPIGLALEIEEGERKKLISFLGLHSVEDEILTAELLYPSKELDQETIDLWYDFIFYSALPTEAKDSTLSYYLDYSHFTVDYSRLEKPSLFIKIVPPSNFPRNVPVTLTLTKLNGDSVSQRLMIGDENCLRFEDGPEFIAILGFAGRGETFKYTLTHKAKKASFEISFFPYKMKDDSGHLLVLHPISAKGDVFMFKGAGFKPNEEVIFYSESEGEKMSHPIKANSDGSLSGMVAPAVIGKKNGKAMIEIRGSTTKNLKLNYKWGPQSFETHNKPSEQREYLHVEGINLNETKK